MTYGLACAPFLALRTLVQLIEDESNKYPLAIPSLTQGRYADDIFGGAYSIFQTQEIVRQLNSMCKTGGFPLQKRISNPAILESISPEKHARSISLHFDETAMIHVLGLCFNTSADAFHFSITSSIPTMTKRIFYQLQLKCLILLIF